MEGIVVNNPQRGFGLLSITTDYIFYAVENASTTKDLYRFPKSPLPTDVPILVDSADDFYFLYSSADSLYYEKMEKSGSAVVNYTAVAINEDLNNSQVYNQSRWVGVANFSYSYENLTPGGNMLLANNYTFIDSGIAGADLQEYDLKTRVLLSTIGEVPGTVLGIGLNIYPKYGDSMIASATAVSASTTSGYQEDIFIINPNTIPVFANLTNTPTLDEKVIY